MRDENIGINIQQELVDTFHYEINEDNIRHVHNMLTENPELINWEDDTWNKGFTPIMSAIISKNGLLVFNYLLQNDRIDLTVLNKVKESALFLAINLQINGVVEQLLQSNPELLFSKYKGTHVNTDMKGYSPTRYVKTLYDRIRANSSPNDLSMYYLSLIDILDNFYTDYETYYMRGDNDEMRITRTGEFTRNIRRRRLLTNLLTRRRPRAARTPSTRSRRSSSSGSSSASGRSRASRRSNPSARSSRRSSASGRSTPSARSRSSRSRSDSSQASTDSFDSGASFTSSQLDELSPDQYSRVYANMSGR